LVRYTPLEAGEYKITLQWDAWTIPGSPFVAKVVDVGAVRLISGVSDEQLRGWQTDRLAWLVELNEKQELRFDLNQAGPGKLSVSVQSASVNVPVEVEQAYEIGVASFSPTLAGEYTVEARWQELLIAPFPMRLVAENLEAVREAEQNQVTVSGRGLREARCGQLAQFQVTVASEPVQAPRARLELSEVDGEEVEVTLEPVAVLVEAVDTHIFSCTYQPPVAGRYALHVMVSEQHVRGSPFMVQVMFHSVLIIRFDAHSTVFVLASI
jgi:hypothetical protein